MQCWFSFIGILMILGLVSGCSDKKVYSPITAFTYCDDSYLSNHVDDKLSFARCFTDFVQYPDDWTKLGLKGKVKKVFSIEDKLVTELEFDEYGHVIHQGQVLSQKYGYSLDFEYQDGMLVQVGNRKTWTEQIYLYNEDNRLVTCRTDNYEKKYTYYDNGVLKNVFVVKSRDSDGILKMECDKTGKVLMLRMWCQHPIVSCLAETDFTYDYNSDGLCSAKYGKALLRDEGVHIGKKYYNLNDSLFSISRYTYNEKQDLVKWEEEYYTGNREISGKFTIDFSYEYDKEGNWVRRTASSEEEVLKLLYPKYSFVQENGMLVSKLERNFEYYLDKDLEVMQEQKKIQSSGDVMTARSLFQLMGPVKEVAITQTSGNGNSMEDMGCFQTGIIKAFFDKRGMLEAISFSGGPVDYRFILRSEKYICEAKEVLWQYPSYFRYVVQDNVLCILACMEFKDGNKGNDEVEVFKMVYDKKNERIISTSDMLAGELMNYAGGNILNSTYHYNDNSSLPSSISITMPFGGDEYMFEFQPVYEKIDKYGNWQTAQFMNEGKMMYSQKRKIVYYD